LAAVLVRPRIVISRGERRCACAMRLIAGAIVAENSATCRSGGTWPRIEFIASTKPIASISSASSSTT
jgi:hypothetical protein